MDLHTLSTDDAQSPTGYICEQAELFGVTPGPDEFDTREIWHKKSATNALRQIYQLFVSEILTEGFQLHDETEPLLWGITHVFHAQASRLERAIDPLIPQLQDLIEAEDGTEMHSFQLQRTQERAQNLNDRRDAMEILRNAATELYHEFTTNHWQPRRGSFTTQTSKITAASIDAKEYISAKQRKETEALTPQGTLIAVTGSKTFKNDDYVLKVMEACYTKHPDMVLLHGGNNQGPEAVASLWAKTKGIQQVFCKPNWDSHGRSAPFRRNDEVIKLLPAGIIAFPGEGIVKNLVQKATAAGIPVKQCAGPA